MTDQAVKKRRWKPVLGALLASAVAAVSGLPVISGLGKLLFLAFTLIILIVALFKLLRILLWSVGRRLAFSYLLIGVLPIPMVLTIAAVGTYLLSGLFLGHLFRNALFEIYRETAAVGRAAAEGFADPDGLVEIAWYRDGLRVSGTELAPEQFPGWLAEETKYILAPENKALDPPLVALEDGRLTLAAAFIAPDGMGRVAVFTGGLEAALRSRTSVWVELLRSDDPRLEPALTLEIFDETYFLVPPQLDAKERGTFLREAELDEGEAFRIVGFERCGAAYSLATGSISSPTVSANLYGQAITVYRNLFSSGSRIDSLAWLAFLIPAFLLFDLYILALLMAIFIIFSLSRAVDRLSRGTKAVMQGDFSARIPVRRSDQIGELHTSFNNMTGNLEKPRRSSGSEGDPGQGTGDRPRAADEPDSQHCS